MRLFLLLLVLVHALSAVAADTPVRLAKGPSSIVFTRVALSGATNSTTVNGVDWSAYAALQIVVEIHQVSDPDGINTSCTHNPTIAVLGGTKFGGTYDYGTEPYSAVTLDNYRSALQSYVVPRIMPYVKFNLQGSASTGTNACFVTVTVVPLPISEVVSVTGPDTLAASGPTITARYPIGIAGKYTTGGVTATRILSIDAGGRMLIGATRTGIAATAVSVTSTATRVHTSAADRCGVLVTNRDTVDAYCSETSGVTSSSGTPLNAASATGKAGGSQLYDYYGGDVWCITASGTATVNVQPRSCSNAF